MDKEFWIKKFKKADRLDKFSVIVDRCKGKKVLDVGCVGQDKHIDNEDWLHGRIKKVASNLVGADIEPEGIRALNNNGFVVFTPEELEKQDEKYDVIVMGDVIEHVNDPSVFLSFYAQFLIEGGDIIICTPNAFGIRYIIEVFLYGRAGTNEEHTMIFDPYVLLELFSRIGIKPKEFFWLKEYHKGGNFKQKIVLFWSSLYIFLRRYYNSNFMFVVGKE